MSDLAACGSSLAWHGCYQVEADLCTPESYAHPAKEMNAAERVS